MKTLLCTSTLVAAALAFAGAAQAAFPDRPITLVVPFAAGGPTDVVARSLGAAMTAELGQTVVVENRVGAGGTIAGNHVARANPDGHTLLIHHNGMATQPALHANLPYTPLADFEYIGQVVDVPMTMLGRKDLPPDDLNSLIAYLKKNASRVNVADAGQGAVSQLCGILFRQAIGVELQTIPYQGTGPAMAALLGQQVDLLCDQTTQTLPHIKAGAVKAYGATTLERVPSLPDLPTLHEQGLKDFRVVVWHGVYAPKGTPEPTLKRLNEALRVALKDPQVQTRMKDLGAQIVSEDKQTPEGLRDWLAQETALWGPLLKPVAAANK